MKALLEQFYDDFINEVAFDMLEGRPTMIFCTKTKLKEDLEKAIKDNLRLYSFNLENGDPQKPSCEHKWRDFDWYLSYTLKKVDSGRSVLAYSIMEPYVCIHCHERKDVTLETGEIPLSDTARISDILDNLVKSYPRLKYKADIEDAINDEIHVDREYLKFADYLNGRGEKPNADISLKL